MSGPRYREPREDEIFDRQFLIKDQHDQPIVNDDGEELVGGVLDNRSITKQYLGKVSYGSQLGQGIKQLLHPEIAGAVEFTGKFERNPYGRVGVSLNPILAVMYAKDPRAAGEYVRRMHEGISGEDFKGRKFNALSRDAFYWAHDTFRDGSIKTAENYGRVPLTDTDREQAYFESNTWYSYYGMSMNMVPADRQANLAYQQDMLDHRLEVTPIAARAIDNAVDRNPPRPEAVPEKVWALAKVAIAPMTEVVSLMTIGEIDPPIREKFGIPFSAEEQKQLNELRDIAKVFIDPLPESFGYAPIAHESLLRERGGEHRNGVDHVAHEILSLGGAAAKRIIVPVLKRAQSMQAKIAA